jgi:O-acetyl-ADP-ribose deacetylase (regulator of RNase III)/pimeloyl-ACP methyl ester carboxylesterase
MEKTERSYKFGASTVTIRLGDITTSQAQVLVSSDDTRLSMRGGVSEALLKVGGPAIRNDADKKLAEATLGAAVVTTAGELRAAHIFHAVTREYGSPPIKDPEKEQAIIEEASRLCLDKLIGLKLRSIAFPALGTGFAEFDPVTVAATMAKVLRKLLVSIKESLDVSLYLHPDSVKTDLGFWQFAQQLDMQAGITDEVIPDHAVALIHGIMTEANWFDRVDKLLRTNDHQLYPIPCGFGTFDVVRFLTPGKLTKRAVIRKVERELLRLCKDESFKYVSVVAHSFGTYILSQILRKHSDIKLHRVILCGAVLPQHYNWEQHRDQINVFNSSTHRTYRVMNDCGWKDNWPVFAKFMTWGYGMAGRTGFQSPASLDRYHNAGHSDFFSNDFVSRFWLPFLANGEVREVKEERPTGKFFVVLLNAFKLPHLVIAFLLWWLVL